MRNQREVKSTLNIFRRTKNVTLFAQHFGSKGLMPFGKSNPESQRGSGLKPRVARDEERKKDINQPTQMKTIVIALAWSFWVAFQIRAASADEWTTAAPCEDGSLDASFARDEDVGGTRRMRWNFE